MAILDVQEGKVLSAAALDALRAADAMWIPFGHAALDAVRSMEADHVHQRVRERYAARRRAMRRSQHLDQLEAEVLANAEVEHAQSLRTWRRMVTSRQQIAQWKASLAREFEGAVHALDALGCAPQDLLKRPDLMPHYLRALEHVPRSLEQRLAAGHALSEEELQALRHRTELVKGEEAALNDAKAKAKGRSKGAAQATSSALAPAATAAPAAATSAAAVVAGPPKVPKPPRFSVARSIHARRVAAHKPRNLSDDLLKRTERKKTIADRLMDRERAALGAGERAPSAAPTQAVQYRPAPQRDGKAA